MKTFRPMYFSAAMIFITAVWNSSVFSQTVWEGDFNNSGEFRWAEGFNWTAGSPNVGGQNAEFRTIGAGNSTIVTVSSGGDIGGSLTFAGGVNNASAYTFNLAGNAGERLGLSGDITNSSSNSQVFNGNIAVEFTAGARSITNSGTGSLTFNTAVANPGRALTVANSNNSAPVVFNNSVTASSITKNGSGTIVFNGSSSGVTVNAGRMEGIGTVSGLTTIGSGASYSAGNGIGSQNLAGGLTFLNNGATPNFVFDVNKTAPNTFTFDTLTVGGAGLNIGTGFRTEIANTGSALVAGDFWDVFSSSNGIANSSNLTANLFNITGSNPNGLSFQWSLITSGSNTIGRITAVPEPSSMALLGMAGLIGGVYARRRAKKNKA